MYIGIDIGGTKTAVILSDDSGKITGRTAFPTLSKDETLKKVYALVEEAGPARAIGISCGGPLDEAKGLILSPPNLPGWDNVQIVKDMSERFGTKVRLCNDANACALAEWRFGAGQGTKNMIFMTFGTGLGAGLILDGKLYSGTNGNAGETGHIRLTDYGPVGYGKAGSFEGYCSGGGIRQLGRTFALEQLQTGKSCAYCRSMDELDQITAKSIAEAADAGDPVAKHVYAYCGEKLGYGLSILIDLFNPEAIVIGSIFARSGHLLRESMERVIRENALPSSWSVCRIVPASLGEQIGDYGAIAAAMMA
ncbi:MAG: ROK family protein [Clostridia bacterium]|nr:ROK family protein [Clostridia bacterium]